MFDFIVDFFFKVPVRPSTYAGPPKPVLRTSLPAENVNVPGLKVDTMFVMHQDQVKLRLLITNSTPSTLETFLIRFKPNMYASTGLKITYHF